MHFSAVMDLGEEGDLQQEERRDNCQISSRFSLCVLCWVSQAGATFPDLFLKLTAFLEILLLVRTKQRPGFGRCQGQQIARAGREVLQRASLGAVALP